LENYYIAANHSEDSDEPAILQFGNFKESKQLFQRQKKQIITKRNKE